MSSNNHDQNSDAGTNPIAGALTYPSSNSRNSTDGNEQVVPSQPRQPTNLQGLLQFALEATKSEDAHGDSQLVPMDEEQRRFLEDAMKSLTVNVAGLLQESIKVLADRERIYSVKMDQPIPVDIKTAFDNLLDYIDHIDVAIDFCKVGGMAIFPVCYGSENEIIRTLTSTVLGEMCQNNPFCQAKVLECGLIRVLLDLAGTEKSYALTKTIFALSCAIRGFDPGCHEFVAQDGCATLVKVLERSEGAARFKTFFLICVLCHNFPQCRVKFIETNLVSVIAHRFKKKMNEKIQIYLSILQDLIKDPDPRLTEQIRDPNLRLKSSLEDLLELPQLQGDLFEKEKEFCLQILARGFGQNSQLDEDGPDR